MVGPGRAGAASDLAPAGQSALLQTHNRRRQNLPGLVSVPKPRVASRPARGARSRGMPRCWRAGLNHPPGAAPGPAGPHSPGRALPPPRRAAISAAPGCCGSRPDRARAHCCRPEWGSVDNKFVPEKFLQHIAMPREVVESSLLEMLKRHLDPVPGDRVSWLQWQCWADSWTWWS